MIEVHWNCGSRQHTSTLKDENQQLRCNCSKPNLLLLSIWIAILLIGLLLCLLNK